MKKSVKWRFLLIGLALLLTLSALLPNMPFYKDLPPVIKKLSPDKGIILGLDLQGGLYLVFEVEGQKAVAQTTSRISQGIQRLSDNKNLKADVKFDGKNITVATATPEIRKAIENAYPTLSARDSGSSVVYSLSEKETKYIIDNACEQALETIRNRIDQFGVAEPVIQRQGESEIVVQLPGVKEPKRAIELIGKTAQLEFKVVDDESPTASELPATIKPFEEDELMGKMKAKIPEGDEILFERITNKETGEITKKPLLLKKDSPMAGNYISEARVQIDTRYNSPYVSLTFNAEGAKIFEEITGKYVKKRLAIILDGNVYSAPVIQEKISGGSAQISGSYSMDEAKDLAIVLRAGALPAPVNMLQNITVGPSLGTDSIAAGKLTAIAAFIAVAGFMAFYYRISGLIADLALVLNMVFLMGAMAALNATLTMPGIAGIVLAIGMAVDTNVLMFERMRDELKAGKTPRASVDSGYDKAFLTIVDSHVTTLITAAVLYQFGTGPIKGFAVTLSIGIAINLFTSLIGTKAVFDYINAEREVKKLSI
ncbi:MAG: protein translocase subunit SecD [Nitrospirae bacterium]|nr:protein translocase subunit SecD [Nitrospirota bacterium]MBF0534233.1 protein translocase subunit SecD [Nitrospirota bacterium]MBF0615853.1 protein translocase subunit SecD [Nitrospirota bacterium]